MSLIYYEKKQYTSIHAQIPLLKIIVYILMSHKALPKIDFENYIGLVV